MQSDMMDQRQPLMPSKALGTVPLLSGHQIRGCLMTSDRLQALNTQAALGSLRLPTKISNVCSCTLKRNVMLIA